MKQLRYYQQEAVDAIINSWNKKQSQVPYVSVMTGLGKSLIIADITKQALAKGKRVLQLVPRLELVKQNYAETVGHGCEGVGICCGQLNRFEVHKPVVIAMHSSFYSRRTVSGKFDVLLIDECHLVGNDPNSQYRKIVRSLLRLNPKMLIAGLTGSPWRLGQGMLHQNCIKGEALFTNLVYDTTVHPGIPRLIDEGYLSRVNVVNTSARVDLTCVAMSGLDYNANDAGVKFDAIIDDAVPELERSFIDNDVSTAIIFVSTLANAAHVVERWADKKQIRVVHGDMTKHDRVESVQWIKRGSGRRYIVNVNILTTGFDFPALEAIVLLRATTSPALMVQMVGRLLRPHEGKVGLLYDFGTNLERLGSIDSIVPPKTKKKREEAPKKLCLLCNTPNRLSAKICHKCYAVFISESEDGKYSIKSQAQLIAERAAMNERYFEITEVKFDRSRSNYGKECLAIYFFQNNLLCHTERLWADDKGNILLAHKDFLMSMFKNEHDFFELAQDGHTITNMLILLNQNHNLYFKIFKNIIISNRKMIRWEYEQ